MQTRPLYPEVFRQITACTVDGNRLVLPVDTVPSQMFREAMKAAHATWSPSTRSYTFKENPHDVLGIGRAPASARLTDEVVALADAGDQHVILVGTMHGRLADALRRSGATVDCVEKNAMAAAVCRGWGHRVISCDFLTQVAPDNGYDVAVTWAQAPARAEAYVTHAFTMVRPGAPVIAIVPILSVDEVVRLVDDDSAFVAGGDDEHVIVVLQAPARAGAVEASPETMEEDAAA